jgi:DNA ligase (NAD+)
VVAQHVASFFRQPHNREVIDALRRAGVRWPEATPRAARPAPLTGKSAVLTGTLRSMTREQAKERLEARGARVTGSVSARTSFVVVGEDPGAKADKARELGLETLDETAFLRLLEETERSG